MERETDVYVAPLQPSDSYNGARNEHYVWSQSIGDLDVIVNIPECVKTPSGLRIDVSSTRIKIEAHESIWRRSQQPRGIDNFETRESPNEWTTIFQGQLSFPIKKNESVWSLVAGKHIDIHLEKCKERWWDALIVGEKKINLSKIDRSRDLHDLSEQEQMKIRELMWNERKKILTKSN